MARTAFDGPILSGDNRFGPLRNLGYTDLVQATDIDFTATVPGVYPYSGSSGQFVWGNGIPNQNGTVYVPQNGAFSNAGPTIQALPADTATNIYRGAVFYLPYGANFNDVFIDVGIVPTVASGSITSTTIYVSNNYTVAAGTPAYAQTPVAVPTVGRQALSAFTNAQMISQAGTTQDVQNPVVGQQPTWFSQVVFTVAIVGTGMTTLSAGRFYFTLRYAQQDPNIGSVTTYPYGNFG